MSPRTNAKSYQLFIKETWKLTVADFTTFLTSMKNKTKHTDKLPMIQELNILLGDYAKSFSSLLTVGSSKSFSLSKRPENVFDTIGEQFPAVVTGIA